MKTKALILCFAFLLSIFSSYHSAHGESLAKAIIAPVAIETRVNNKFNGYIGKLDFDYSETIAVVTFGQAALGTVNCLPTVYKIIEKEMRPFNIYYIKAENQYGVILTGFVDASDKLNPKIKLVLEGGVLITNISAEGREMKNKYIPKVSLGSGE